MSKILFVNASPNHDGNTAALAKAMLAGRDYEQLDLVDYKIYAYGQRFDDDQFDEVLQKIQQAQVVVMGSPMYWHNICGLMRNLLDRFYGPVGSGSLAGRKLYFVFQGAAPEKWMLDAGEFTMSRFAGLYGMDWGGMATTTSEAKKLGQTI
ncbi:flavodoxin family protein [Parafannyhessea umbonata]|uniref:NADPH-dependent FMN reductase n=1 Tax=Parafannyhessea umbonata TaxID=604330 RepID=A0A1G6MM46_9ACTN|nr:NAD(P)H-dependent oxidoreductase [Parafannyhessea umbonata]SDC56613.1 NADPH-dependent FMN reductase [Parafannyhessea umbonata]